jgi:uncharacterized protein
MPRTFIKVYMVFVVAFIFSISCPCLVQTSWANLASAEAAFFRGDYAEAFKEFNRLAQDGSAEAQFGLGNLFYMGRGVPQSYAQAAKWYRKAADQGYMFAQASLGVMYEKGQGLSRDYVQAIKWYRRAADQGDTKAQLNLGILYYFGDGVPQDYVQAYMWVNLSAEQGEEIAIEAREGVAKVMTPEQIAKAQRLSGEWKPKKEPNHP